MHAHYLFKPVQMHAQTLRSKVRRNVEVVVMTPLICRQRRTGHSREVWRVQLQLTQSSFLCFPSCCLDLGRSL
jgi:hypothetical protein